MLIKTIKTISGAIALMREIPADFMASNSRFSPKFPNIINDASKIDNGNAMGINWRAAYKNISPSTFNPNPLPIISSTYFHKNCINTRKRHIANVIRNSGI